MTERPNGMAAVTGPTRPVPHTLKRWPWGRRLTLAIATSVGLLAHSGGIAAMTVDHDVMYLLVGVTPNLSDPIYRTLTYRATNLTTEQKAFLTGIYSPNLYVWQKYSKKKGEPATHVYYVHPGYVDKGSVTQWNQSIGSKRTPTAGETVTRRSEWAYDSGGRYGIESCLGVAPADNSPISALTVMPGTTCPTTPPATGPTCTFSTIPNQNLGSLAVGQAASVNWSSSVTCDQAASVTIGPVTFTGQDSGGLEASVGNTYCNNLGATTTLTMGAETKNYCISLSGRYTSPGAKQAQGVVNVSYK